MNNESFAKNLQFQIGERRQNNAIYRYQNKHLCQQSFSGQ